MQRVLRETSGPLWWATLVGAFIHGVQFEKRPGTQLISTGWAKIIGSFWGAKIIGSFPKWAKIIGSFSKHLK